MMLEEMITDNWKYIQGKLDGIGIKGFSGDREKNDSILETYREGLAIALKQEYRVRRITTPQTPEEDIDVESIYR